MNPTTKMLLIEFVLYSIPTIAIILMIMFPSNSLKDYRCPYYIEKPERHDMVGEEIYLYTVEDGESVGYLSGHVFEWRIYELVECEGQTADNWRKHIDKIYIRIPNDSPSSGEPHVISTWEVDCDEQRSESCKKVEYRIPKGLTIYMTGDTLNGNKMFYTLSKSDIDRWANVTYHGSITVHPESSI